MANPLKGEVSFKSGDKEYTLSLSINALCELDEALGVEDALNTLVAKGKLSLKQSRTMFHVALKQHHPEIADEKEAAKLVTLGDMNRLLIKAIQLANGNDDEPAVAAAASAGAKPNGAAAHPQEPDQGAPTGPAS